MPAAVIMGQTRTETAIVLRPITNYGGTVMHAMSVWTLRLMTGMTTRAKWECKGVWFNTTFATGDTSKMDTEDNAMHTGGHLCAVKPIRLLMTGALQHIARCIAPMQEQRCYAQYVAF